MVRGTRGNQLLLPVTIQTQDMVLQFRVIGLIDSGCTGSCIDIGLVQRQKIPMKKLPVPQPVYNADGTLNAAGRITEFVDVRMTVMNHSGKNTTVGHEAWKSRVVPRFRLA